MAELSTDEVAIRRRNVTLGLLTAAYFFSYMDRQILAILQEDIKAELLLSDTQLGLLAGFAFAIFYATLGLPVARWADKGNRVNIIGIALALWSAMTAVCGLAQNFVQLLLARIGVGIGEAGSSPPSHSIIADLYPPEKRAGAMGIYSLGVVLGVAGGSMIGGTLAHFFGWRVAMFAVGIPGIILAVVIKLFVVEPRRGLSDPDRALVPQAAMPGFGEGFRSLFANRAAVHLVMGVTITSLIGYGHTAFGPSFLIRTLGLDKLQIASIVAPVGAVCGTLSAVLGGWLANKAAERWGLHSQAWLVLAMKGVGLPLSFLFYAAGDPWIAVPIYWASLILINSYLGPTFALIQGLAPLRMRALWAAVTLLVINLIGLGLGPTLIGVISDTLKPSMGDAEALRWAMLSFAAATPWALFHYWRAGVWLKRRAG
ncbi:MFS transporter [Sphingomonas koreensis]|jgi:MFS family permease|uniref:MFS transporter n=1 Tax=Sphingomonas koreensis TaxID=93064 RepID=A0A1L6JA53_9SPHN|nr:MFS transporter [Sphingomonas koreensis]APR52803.1 MFS transporter [Sphingomonas koreensis]MDC7811139.1 MFS transporter [Sphingomonas koreensis]RSU19313.1 MFS transporter [Sphingomonas koreensis]RSU28365.1 MFS transporter [Sphingomonas koreensis]RSU31315.1 MFS transporter [Sphingomonas koreensis]